MELERGQLVRVLAGHDKGELMVVLGFQGQRVLLCDGKHHKTENPKCKNVKHIQLHEQVLDVSLMTTDRKIRKMLNKIANPGG